MVNARIRGMAGRMARRMAGRMAVFDLPRGVNAARGVFWSAVSDVITWRR